ncbi:MAG: hypothetical protein J6D38_04090 [Solobacterium sp.]|nr:hypothetical protein [Solobacterium sp.]MBR3347592.1 hypothetical protein [Solobacterium sp.]
MSEFNRNIEEDLISRLKARKAEWIHDKIPDKSYVQGFKYSAACRCSICGFRAAHEMYVCPGCKTVISKTVAQ